MNTYHVVYVALSTACSWHRINRVRIVHIGDEEAEAASAMLINAGLHGHKYAIDAAVAEMALRQSRPVVMLTSDIDEMAKLCGDRVRLAAE